MRGDLRGRAWANSVAAPLVGAGACPLRRVDRWDDRWRRRGRADRRSGAARARRGLFRRSSSPSSAPGAGTTRARRRHRRRGDRPGAHLHRFARYPIVAASAACLSAPLVSTRLDGRGLSLRGDLRANQSGRSCWAAASNPDPVIELVPPLLRFWLRSFRQSGPWPARTGELVLDEAPRRARGRSMRRRSAHPHCGGGRGCRCDRAPRAPFSSAR